MNQGGPVRSVWRVLLGRERRKAERRVVPGLVAYYWNGGSPAPRPVREISLTGMYLLTEERWYVGTVVSMRLQQTETADEDPKHSIAVHARAIRWGDDGVGMAFLPPGQNPYQNGHDPQNSSRDSKSMKRFVREI